MNSTAIQHALRLGSQFTPPNLSDADKVIEGVFIPEPIQHFLFGLSWPRRLRFTSKENSGFWVWRVALDLFDWIDPNELPIEDRGERPLICFGEADSGNILLALALDDPDPSDPIVFKLEHDAQLQRLGPGLKLSQFLALLEPEED